MCFDNPKASRPSIKNRPELNPTGSRHTATTANAVIDEMRTNFMPRKEDRRNFYLYVRFGLTSLCDTRGHRNNQIVPKIRN